MDRHRRRRRRRSLIPLVACYYYCWVFFFLLLFGSSPNHYCFCRRIVVVSSTNSLLAAFAAGGGGFGKSTSRPGVSRQQQKKRQKTKSKNKRNNNNKGLQRRRDEDLASTGTVDKKEEEDEEGQPKLDKWGLPIPTIDDIFPPMPPGTELIPATKDDYTLQEIQDALRQHISLDLEKHFHQNGIEIMKNPPSSSDRSPMKLRLLHQSPPVLAIDNYFTQQECLDVERVAMPSSSSSSDVTSEEDGGGGGGGSNNILRPVVVESKTFALAQSRRTSTSWFCHYEQVPVLLAKTRHCLGIPLERMEEPQIVRYKTGQEFR